MAGHRENQWSACKQPLFVLRYRKKLWICNCGQVWKREKYYSFDWTRTWKRAGTIATGAAEFPAAHIHYEYASQARVMEMEKRILALEYPKKPKKRVQKGA